MSTFVSGPIFVAACIAAGVVWSRRRFGAQPATLRVHSQRGPVPHRAPEPPRLDLRHLAAIVTAPFTSRVRHLAHEALGTRSPQQAEYGESLRISPLRRIRSAILLLTMLIGLGIATAASIGLLAFLAGFLLEQAIK